MNNRVDKPAMAIVTGADGGIGRAYCRSLASMGINLVVVSIADDSLRRMAKELAEEFRIMVYPVTLDLTLPDSTAMLIQFLEEKGLQPDMLINNAGIFSFIPIIESDPRKIDCFIDLHIRSLTTLSREFASRFASAGRGWILNMSSMSCWMPMPGLAMYAATKAYIRVFSRSLALEMRDAGVKVMVACPGGIATDLFGLPKNLQKLALRLGAIQSPEKFARNAIRQLLKGKMQYINGPLNRIAIPAVGATPTWMRMMVKHKMLDRGIVRR